jgi:hypothetical protein
VAAPRAQASGPCSGTITVQLAGVRQIASRIEVRNVSCAAGRSVARSFLERANRQAGCRSAALRGPPTSGCVVSGYHCFFRKTVNYCVTVSRREVSWRQALTFSRCALGRGQRPFFQEITASGVVCATAQAAIRVWGSTMPFRPFRAAGRGWTWGRTFLGPNRVRTRLRSGRAEVVFVSMGYS